MLLDSDCYVPNQRSIGRTSTNIGRSIVGSQICTLKFTEYLCSLETCLTRAGDESVRMKRRVGMAKPTPINKSDKYKAVFILDLHC
jgi:hypothetical protein